MQNKITYYLMAASPGATAPTAGAAGHAGTSSAVAGTPRRHAAPRTTGPAELGSPPAAARAASTHQGLLDSSPLAYGAQVHGQAASRLGGQRSEPAANDSCGQASARRTVMAAAAAAAGGAQASAPVSVSAAAAKALPPSPSGAGAAARAHSVSSTDSGDERPAKAARLRDADAPGRAGGASRAAVAGGADGNGAGAAVDEDEKEVNVRLMFGSQESSEEGQDESPGGSQDEVGDALAAAGQQQRQPQQQIQQQQQQPSQGQQVRRRSADGEGHRRRSSGGLGAGGSGGGAGPGADGEGFGLHEEGGVEDAHSEGGGGNVDDIGEDDDEVGSQWAPHERPQLGGVDDAEPSDAKADRLATGDRDGAAAAGPVHAGAAARPQRKAAIRAMQQISCQKPHGSVPRAAAAPAAAAAAVAEVQQPAQRQTQMAGTSSDKADCAGSDSAGGDQYARAPPAWNPARPGYVALQHAVEYRAAVRAGEVSPEEGHQQPSCWGVRLLGERPVVMNMVLMGNAAQLFTAAEADMLQNGIWDGVPLLSADFSSVVHGNKAEMAKQSVLRQLEHMIRLAVHKRLKTTARPEDIPVVEILANLPEYLPHTSKVELSVIGRGPHASVFDDTPALWGQDTLCVRRGCQLEQWEVVGIYSGEACTGGDWQMFTLERPDVGWDDRDHPCPFHSTAALRHEKGRFAADGMLPKAVRNRRSKLQGLDPKFVKRLANGERLFVSAARLGCPVSAVNDPRRDIHAPEPDFRAPANVAVQVVHLLGCLSFMVMFALERVPGGGELLYDYGEGYWHLHAEESRAMEEAAREAQERNRQLEQQARELQAEREANRQKEEEVQRLAQELQAARQREAEREAEEAAQRQQRAQEQARLLAALEAEKEAKAQAQAQAQAQLQAAVEAGQQEAQQLAVALAAARAEIVRLSSLAGDQRTQIAAASAHLAGLEQQLSQLQESQEEQQQQQQEAQADQQEQLLGASVPPPPPPAVRGASGGDGGGGSTAATAAQQEATTAVKPVPEDGMEVEDAIVNVDQTPPPQTPPHPAGEDLSPREDEPAAAFPVELVEAEAGVADEEAPPAVQAEVKQQQHHHPQQQQQQQQQQAAAGQPAADYWGMAADGVPAPVGPPVMQPAAAGATQGLPVPDAEERLSMVYAALDAITADAGAANDDVQAIDVRQAPAGGGALVAAAGPMLGGGGGGGAALSGADAGQPSASQEPILAPGVPRGFKAEAGQAQSQEQALTQTQTQGSRRSRKRPREDEAAAATDTSGGGAVSQGRHRDRCAKPKGKLSLQRSQQRLEQVKRADQAAERASAAAAQAMAAAAAALAAAATPGAVAAPAAAAPAMDEAVASAESAQRYMAAAVAAAEAARQTAPTEVEAAQEHADKAEQAATRAQEAASSAERAVEEVREVVTAATAAQAVPAALAAATARAAAMAAPAPAVVAHARAVPPAVAAAASADVIDLTADDGD
ncbi:hypothetical protein HYH02_003548 [Chlamydomonas schloesseri]|uniref:RING-type E3 ubiquitin transferase n=1 Tax=Chlamydomonas schloesseri TaxID=2026947 RepID=A0A835WPP8_9CHLO|nr:hypothetical protein HYH02_003548 [Chlamydomonas schloesseri]|eukprot:KAG2451769.1 hypothetical protein HYH02_003548 [Chlamydomonas schloesseri]